MVIMSRFVFLIVPALVAFPLLAMGYSFEFTSKPTQCQNLSLKITGTDGKPPYQLVLVPSGPSPLQNGVEARIVTVEKFPDNQDTLTFKLAYPANSKFVAVVSDATGFGTGGTSAETGVETSSDNSCFDSSKSAEAAYIFNISPPVSIIQCQPTRIWWDKKAAQGNTQFQGVIPAGQSFTIPIGKLSDVQDEGSGFNWTANIRASTPMFILAGDERGLGSAGCADYTVAYGTNPVTDCINANSPSITPGQPAGAVQPTSTGGGSNTAPIVGGVVGGVGSVVVIVLVFVFFFRRRRTRRPSEIDLLHSEEDDGNPQHYRAEPFVLSVEESRRTSNRPSIAMTSHGDLLGIDPTPMDRSSAGHKSAAGPPQLRVSNVIQHEDAGPSELPNAGSGVVETIELPPAYSNIRAH